MKPSVQSSESLEQLYLDELKFTGLTLNEFKDVITKHTQSINMTPLQYLKIRKSIRLNRLARSTT